MAKNSRSGSLVSFLRNLIYRFVVCGYFHKIISAGLENIPADGHVVLACNHRNGAVDGAVIKYLLPYARFVVGKNLTQSFFMRIFFGGQIDIYRKAQNEKERLENQAQILHASQATCAGNPLVMFPEGTSKLGPSLLPLKKGIYRLIRTIFEIRRDERPVYVAPIGLHYERGWAFRSDVYVTAGTPWRLSAENLEDADSFMAEIRERLMDVSISYEDKDGQIRAETFADLVSRNTELTHREACRLFAGKKLPADLLKKYDHIYPGPGRGLRPQIPPVFDDHAGRNILCALVLTPLVVTAFALNLIPALAAYLAGRIMADDDNVIALWRCLVGLPLLVIQWVTYLAVLIIAAGPLALAGFIVFYVAVTAPGVGLFKFWKYAVIKVMNRLILPGKEICDFMNEVRQWQKTNR